MKTCIYQSGKVYMPLRFYADPKVGIFYADEIVDAVCVRSRTKVVLP